MAYAASLAFLVGAARCARAVAVPDVVGMPLAEAKTTLIALGFLVAYTGTEDLSTSDAQLAGKVVTQSLPPGKQVAPGALVEIRAYATAPASGARRGEGDLLLHN